jgi:hypothetical protein
VIPYGVCRYCKYATVSFDPKDQLWKCKTCHLSSRHDFRLEGSPPPSFIPQEAQDKDIAKEVFTTPRGLNVSVRRYVPALDKEDRPDLKINIERAQFMKKIYEQELANNEAFGYEWMEDQGYVQYDHRNVNGKEITFWCEPDIDADDYYEED